jgi:hypothetical protein
VADGANGVVVLKVAASYGPDQVGFYYFDGYAKGIAVAGDYAYLASRNRGLVVVDIADPTGPTEAGSYVTAGGPKAVAVAGDHAYVADGPTGLVVIDISTPSNPTEVGSCVTANPAYDVALAGDHAYVADSYSGLVVIDVSDPSNPVEVGSCDTEGIAIGVALAGDYAYVADRDSGLMVFNISLPSSPAAVGSCYTDGLARGVALAGDYAYVASTSGGLAVVDISSPSSPVMVGAFDTYGAAYEVAVSGDYAYVADAYGGLAVIDISVPAAPVGVGSYVTVGAARDVVVAGDLAYVSLDGEGLRIFWVLDRSVDIDANKGQSLRLPESSPTDTIRAVRLTTFQTDTVTWEISADSSNWQSMTAGAWTELAYPDTRLYWRSTHSYINYKANPTVHSLTLEWLDEEPGVEAITDVPGDEGGSVEVNFHRSAYDFVGEPDPIVSYYVWRRVEAVSSGSRCLKPEPSAYGDMASLAVGVGDFPPGEWALAGSTLATQLNEYLVAAETAVDSGEAGAYYSVFVVTAHTADSAVYYVSEPDSGYSVDNLAPSVPTGLGLEDSLLSWDECPDEDFDHFSVYGSESGDFGSAVFIGHTVTLAMDVTGHEYSWFHVTATDSVGNESEDASISADQASVSDVHDLPGSYFLTAGTPNPFAANVAIRFGLPCGGHTKLSIFDVTGRHVATLLDKHLPAGRHSLSWRGTDGSGMRVSAGIYFVSLQSGRFAATGKLVLIH